MPLETEAVKQRFLRSCPLTHHRTDPPQSAERMNQTDVPGASDFFNRIFNKAVIGELQKNVALRCHKELSMQSCI